MLKDLTQGRPGRVLLLYAIPSLISVVFQQLYNMADNVVAGQFLGDSALSAVSVTYPVTMLYLAVALGINAGSNILISQLFGAKRMEDMKTAVSTAMLSCIAISVILMVLGLVFCQPLLRLLSTPVDLIADTSRYLLIYTCGLPFIFLYNICTSVFTALGDTVTPLIFLVISSLSNIGLNVVFVTAVELGVAGLALATFICQAAAGLVSLFVLLRRLHKIPCGRWKRYSLPLLRSLSALAVPSILQKSSISIGNLLIQGLVNSFEATVPRHHRRLLLRLQADLCGHYLEYRHQRRPCRLHRPEYRRKETGAPAPRPALLLCHLRLHDPACAGIFPGLFHRRHADVRPG